MQVTPARVVAFLTPVFAAGSAALTPWLVKYTGLHINSTEVTTLAVTGATGAVGAALKFLHGQSQWERFYTEFQHYSAPVVGAVKAADPEIGEQIAADAQAQEAKVVAVIGPPADAFPPPAVPPAA